MNSFRSPLDFYCIIIILLQIKLVLIVIFRIFIFLTLNSIHSLTKIMYSSKDVILMDLQSQKLTCIIKDLQSLP